jgi:pyridoxamine 5'-phosphate oxidase
MERIESLVDEVKIGILTTIDDKGAPRSRWMTPVFLPRLKGALYAVTSASDDKSNHINLNPNVSWMFQSKSLDRVATMSGKARIVKDPALGAEVLEAIGPRLQVFWKHTNDPKKLVVIETVVESATWFNPLGEGRYEKEAFHA